ncbi:hypothetical protein [Streptomyces sp. NPDC057363]|uniref:hypothetical protein n=1 Tax=Streptomyces sp. NPDC057363 TaxID=3346107 RepID=UPI0036440896
MEEQRPCLNKAEKGCEGPVEGRPSYAGTGTLIWRCTAHDNKAYEAAQETRTRYPDSSTPPGWFDPAAAGERWDDEY